MDGTNEMVERVAAAIDAVQLFLRFNDWTSDCVPGMPVEICRHTADDDIEVVARFKFSVDEPTALRQCISTARARAAIEAMRNVPEPMRKFHTPGGELIDLSANCNYCGGHEFAWHSLIDEALK